MAITNAQRYRVYGYSSTQVRNRLTKINLFGKDVYVHSRVKWRFLAWEHAVRLHEKKYNKRTWRPRSVQCFNWRVIRGGSSRSMHSWGIAIDIDPAYNPMGTRRTNIPYYVRAAGRQFGIICGLGWSRPDPMHFEYQGGSYFYPWYIGKTLKLGMYSNDCLKVKRRLGLSTKSRLYGPKTRDAVKHFQRVKGLKVTGIVDDATWKRMKIWKTSA